MNDFIIELSQTSRITPLPECLSDWSDFLENPLHYPDYRIQTRTLYHNVYDLIQDTSTFTQLSALHMNAVRETFGILAAIRAVLVDPNDAFKYVDTGFIMAGMKPNAGRHVHLLRTALNIAETLANINPIPPLRKITGSVQEQFRVDKTIPKSWHFPTQQLDVKQNINVLDYLNWGSSEPSCIRHFQPVVPEMERILLYHLFHKSRHRFVPVERGPSYMTPKWTTQIVRLGQAVADIQNGKPCYIAQFPLHEHIPALKGKVVHDISEKLPRGRIVTQTWLGGSESASPLHTDPFNNIYIQLMGRKFFRLHSPDDVNFLDVSKQVRYTE